MNKLISATKNKVGLLSSNSSPGYTRISGYDDYDSGHRQRKAKKGHVQVIVGGERFTIRTELMAHPSIAALLEMSAEELGYRQEGVLEILCEPDYFREIIKNLTSSMKKR